jgi:hypothetical protein
MKRLSRRQVLGGAAATAAAVTLGAPAVHAQKGRRTLRFVAQADLKILDPIFNVVLKPMEWFQPTAFRKEVHGLLKFTAPVFWNVKIT